MFENLTPGAALPSLNALRAFEAMARTGSATLAGAELNVTHSAVSRQVKALEAQMGVRLFEGPRHALTLTRAGRDLLPGLTAAFDGLAAAVARARSEGQDLHVAGQRLRIGNAGEAQVRRAQAADARQHEGGRAAVRGDGRFQRAAQVLPWGQADRQGLHRLGLSKRSVLRAQPF